MKTKNNISPAKKILYGIMLLGLFLSAFSAGNLPTAHAAVLIPPAKMQETAALDEVIAYHPLTGMARFISSPVAGRPIHQATALEVNATNEEVARSFLAVEGAKFGIADVQNDLVVLRENRIESGKRTTERFQQTYQGIPVLAGEMIVQMDSNKNVLSASGEILPSVDLDITPAIDEAIAIQTALEATAKENGINIEDLQASVPELWIYNPALLTPYTGETVLTWRIEVTPKTEPLPVRQLVLVEAQRGGIVLSFNQVDFAKNRLTYDGGGTSTRPGTLICDEALLLTCPGGSTDAVNAHTFAGQVYDFYMTKHGRDSIDGAGMDLISTVNYDNVAGLPAYANAFWDGDQMIYGAGFISDDIAGHEFTHGVTQNESNLFYYYQSGAINESFSDIWGEFVDQINVTVEDTPTTKWLLGEDLPGGGATRDMEDPTVFGDPDRMTSANYYTGTADEGGVHTNSGVNNKAAYLMVEGGTFNTIIVSPLGIDKVAKIYYYAQTNLLVSGSDYGDLYYALQASCSAQIGVIGISSTDCLEVLDAVNAVEMNQQPVAGFNTHPAACDVAGESPSNIFYDDLETGSANWAHGAARGTDRWSYDANLYGGYYTSAHSGEHFLFANAYPESSTDTYIRMINSVTIPANGKMLFYHTYDFENGYDGGVLEYSTNAGSSWIDAGSLMDGNGYDSTLNTIGNNGPLAGRQAFTNASHGYISTRLNLSSLVGQNVIFRFRMGQDSTNYNIGWWLDDIRIYKCSDSPTVASIVRAAPSPTSSASVNFTVTFSESVTGVDMSGPTFSDFSLTTSGVTGAAVTGVSGSGSVYTVTVDTGDNNGTIRLELVDNDSIVDGAGIPNPLGGAGIGNGNFTNSAVYTVDKVFITSIVRANPVSSTTGAASVDFEVTFSESVTGVDKLGPAYSDFSLITTGVTGASVSAVSGSGSVYTVSVNTGSGNGTIRLNLADGDTILDGSGNPLGGADPGNGNYSSGEVYFIDKNGIPFVTSILRDNPVSSITSAASVDFSVTFSEDVTGVETVPTFDDFSLTTTGVTGAAVSGVSGFGSVYTVSVNTGSGDGTIRLDVVDGDTILDGTSNLLGGAGTGNGNYISGEVYTIAKTNPSPTVISIVRSSSNPTNAMSVNYTVTFSETVTGIDKSGPPFNDFTLTTTGVNGAVVSGVSGSGSVYTVTVNTGIWNGTIRLDVVDGDTILDGTGNPLGWAGTGNGNYTNGEVYIVDKVVDNTVLVNSVLPTSRTPVVGNVVTIFNTVLNAGSDVASGITLSMNPAPAGTFVYQQTNCATNAVIGSSNPSLDLVAGGVLCYVLSFTPSATFTATNVHIKAQASNAPSTNLLTGINTWLLRSTAVAGPDIIALTTTVDFHQVACSGANAFAVALSNVGAAATGDITAVANTGSATLPLSISISETNPGTGAIIGDNILQSVGAGANRTVAVFVTYNGCVSFDPAANRIFVEFRDASNNVVGSTSTAVSTNR